MPDKKIMEKLVTNEQEILKLKGEILRLKDEVEWLKRQNEKKWVGYE